MQIDAAPRPAAPNESGDESGEAEPGSYRDRNGAVFYHRGRVLRAISAKALQDWERLSATGFFGRFSEQGRIVATERLAEPPAVPGSAQWAAVLAHARIPFVSYPYEWPFAMLQRAALLHLELMRAALAEGMILKDSSPYNVQWTGVEPVFIDIPSFEALRPGDPWVGYRQFCELFLYPLMLQAYKGVAFRPWLRGSLDGIPAAAMRGLLSGRDLLRPGVLLHVVAQNALQRRYAGSDGRGGAGVRSKLTEAGFGKQLIVNNVSKLQRIVGRMQPAGTRTTWADYAQTHSYEAAEFEQKVAFVRAAAARRHWRLVWDLGCNTGTFSRIAAEYADYVVAMDGDPMAIEQLVHAQAGRPDARRILPLVMNLADPSPAQGWQGLERRAVAERGRPELTLCLALVHHLAIGANLPLRDVIAWLAGLGTSLVIEFVGRDDEMLQRLLVDRDDQYADYDQPTFEALLGDHFDVAEQQPLKGGKRTIYLALARS
ncbi:MAG: methyltransferase [Alphaproteobacteria bacterium]